MFVYSPHLGCNNPAVVTVVAKLQGAADSALTIAAGKGIESITYDSVGEHTIVLKDKTLGTFLGGHLTVGEAIPAGVVASFKATSNEIYNASTQSVTVILYDTDGGAAVDIPTTDQLCMVLFFQKTTISAV